MAAKCACTCKCGSKAALAEITALLSDDTFSRSKDWKSGNAADRIRWLLATVEAQREEIEMRVNQVICMKEEL